jgi:Rod binding domain-containing protein
MRTSSAQVVSNGGVGQGESQRTRLLSVCKEFEEVFHRMMMRSMRKTVPDGGLFPSSPARKIYGELLDAEYAKAAAESGGMGIADMLYEYLLPVVPESEEENGESAA